jgi:hypothetical protein
MSDPDAFDLDAFVADQARELDAFLAEVMAGYREELDAFLASLPPVPPVPPLD